MLKNYLKIAIRNLSRHPTYSFLNISGLAIGMAASILILLWVQNELSYDRFNANADQIYRITVVASDQFKAATNPAGMPAGLQAAMPEIRNTVRVSHPVETLFEKGDIQFVEKKGFYADSTLLDIFSFPLIKGDRRTALQRPDGILITEEMASRYFGHSNALGKTLKKDNGELVKVTGVLANIPATSSLQFDYILPMSAVARTVDELKNSVWDKFNFYSYVQLDKNFVPGRPNLDAFDRKMTQIYQRHIPRDKLKADFFLQPLTSIHLHSDGLQVDLPGHGNSQYVSIFFIVAVFILLVACINFMNLATARSARRAKEVGLRKVVGAVRGQLIGQFLGESLLISFLALVLAIVIVSLSLPAFNILAEKELHLHFSDGKFWLSLIGVAALTGLLAGSYPALYLSGFQPVKVLKGRLKSMGGNLAFRNGLVITQFVLSIVLLTGTVVVYNQLKFIQHRNPGFTKANLLYMPMTGEIWGRQVALRDELSRNPLTSNYTIVGELPVNLISGNVDGKWPGKDPNTQIVIPGMNVSESFIDVFRMRILAGRGFSTAFKTDSNNFIVNETMMRTMGMTLNNVVGQPLSWNGQDGKVIGVVQDFNFKPIQQAIEPLVLKINRYGGNVVVRAPEGRTEATIGAMEAISRKLNPSFPFTYNFLDQDLANLYKGERQMSGIFNLFAGLALLISCLGLYGLSAYLAQERTREIGVRKVLGASVFNIVYLLSTGFTRLVLVSIVIAIPLAVVAINRFLEGYAYHIRVNWWILPLVALAALVVAWLTVSYESLKAAMKNPTKSLKSE
ncbi:ABC transporter permease [Puia dinghuensis]|uniref:ABC transporter permease n=1 Tax=Puia dinghuensis TaxID=1792502 RepID=A0A8J2UG92_9BACT|nr:ABC transporter permease [Puia dinghuensis]GGB11482.1 ABC transporter permease [Puia dinghuensis]